MWWCSQELIHESFLGERQGEELVMPSSKKGQTDLFEEEPVGLPAKALSHCMLIARVIIPIHNNYQVTSESYFWQFLPFFSYRGTNR